MVLYKSESASIGVTDSSISEGSPLAVSVSAAAASKLIVTSVNSGSNPTAGSAFAVVVRSQDPYGNFNAPTQATTITLTRNTGSGTVGGTTTGSLTTSTLTISGVTYSKAESGVSLTATASAGDTLTAANSSSFTVDPGTATHFSIAGGSSQTAGNANALTITAL